MDSFFSSSSTSSSSSSSGNDFMYHPPDQVFGTASGHIQANVKTEPFPIQHDDFETAFQDVATHTDFPQEEQKHLARNQDFFYDQQQVVAQNTYPFQPAQHFQNVFPQDNNMHFYNQPYPHQMGHFVEQPIMMQQPFNQPREDLKENVVGPIKGRRRLQKKASTLHTNSSCCNCGTRETKMWRRNEQGEPECNSCNLYFRNKGVPRPENLWNKPTAQRRRRPVASSVGCIHCSLAMLFGVKKVLGFLILGLSVLSLAINLVVLFPLLRLASRPDKPSTHCIAFITVANDVVSALLNTFYLAPTIILNSPLFSDTIDGFFPTLVSQIFQFCWYMQNFQMILMASNRLVAITFMKPLFFTKKKIVIFIVFSTVYSIVKTCLNVWVLPCCLLLYDHDHYSFTFWNPKQLRNDADLVDLPMYITCFTVSLVFYSVVFVSIRKSNKAVRDCVTSRSYEIRRAHEISYAVQFGAITLFGLFSMLTFRLLHDVLSSRCSFCFSVVPILYIFSITANALIYLYWNIEVRVHLEAGN